MNARRGTLIALPVFAGLLALLLLGLRARSRDSAEGPAAPRPLPQAPPSAAQDPAPPLSPPPEPMPPPRPSFLAPAETADLLREWGGEYERNLGVDINAHSRFGLEFKVRLTHARLLALVDPERVEAEAAAMAADPTAPGRRAWGAALLSELALAGRTRSLSLLRSLAENPDPRLSTAAYHRYCRVDVRVEDRPFFETYARRGEPLAVEALSRLPDPAAGALLREIHAQAQAAKDRTLLLVSREALDRQAILAAPDAATRVAELLRYNPSYEELGWAVPVALARPAPAYVQALRDRLDRELRNSRDRFEQEQAAEAAEARSFESLYVSNTGSGLMTDGAYDQALKAYWQLGGRPTELEARRLREFGYACDPAERLRELLGR